MRVHRCPHCERGKLCSDECRQHDWEVCVERARARARERESVCVSGRERARARQNEQVRERKGEKGIERKRAGEK